jgi:hypothetical protein
MSRMALEMLARGQSVHVSHRLAGGLVRLGWAESRKGWLQLTEEGEALADRMGLIPMPTEWKAWRIAVRRPVTAGELATDLGLTERQARNLLERIRARRVGRRGRCALFLARRAA